MSDDNDQAGYFEDEQVRDEFPGLIARHDHLVRALQGVTDPSMRADLASELRRVSEQITDLTGPPAGVDEQQPEVFEPPVEVSADDSEPHFTAVTTTFVPPPSPEEVHPAFSTHDSPDVEPNDMPLADELTETPHELQTLDLGNGSHSENGHGQAEDLYEPIDSEEPVETPHHDIADRQNPNQTTNETLHDPAAYDEPPYATVANHGDSFGTDSFEPDSFAEATMNGDTNHAERDHDSFASPDYEPERLEYQPSPHEQADVQRYAMQGHEVHGYEAHEYETDPFADDRSGGEFAPRAAQAEHAEHAERSLPPQLARPRSVRHPQAADASTSDQTSLSDQYQAIKPSGMVLAVVGVSLALLAGLLWFGGNDEPVESAVEAVDPASPTSVLPQVSGTDVSAVLENVRVVLAGLGLSSVVVDHRDGVIHVGGPVPTQADYDAATSAATAVAEGLPVDTSALIPMAAADNQAAPPADGVGRPAALQAELNRLLAGTPLIFASGQATISELHQRILNNVVLALSAYPGFSLTIAGFTDELGDNASNEGLSLARAESVRQYLVDQGLPADAFEVQARGEDAATGSEGLAGLERRVEFVVNGAEPPAADQSTLKVAIVAPSASNDLAFTQSMVDAVGLLSSETPIEVSVTDNTFVPEEAAAAVRSYAEQEYDLIIAHGSQFGASLIDIAPQFPNTAFAWGTASDTFGLPNVYAYDAAAQQGGYLLGVVAAMMSANDVVGVVGPIEVGDAALYVNGFEAGAKAQKPGGSVLVSYTGSFSDTGLATETAQSHIAVGADMLTGSAQMVVGAVSAAEQAGALWFGTQSNQAPLAPNSVVASQVYHWEVALRPIIQDIRAGRLAGNTYTADLANGGLVIEYNDAVAMPPEVRQRADQVFADIVNGSIVPPSE